MPESHVPAVFSHQFGPLIKSVLGGYDRLRFRGTLRPLFSPKWMRGLLGSAQILLKDFAPHAQPVSRQIGERARQAAADQNRPYPHIRGRSSSCDKEAWIEQTAQRDDIQEGLLAVLGAVGPCTVILYLITYRTLDQAIACHNEVPQGLSSATLRHQPHVRQAPAWR